MQPVEAEAMMRMHGVHEDDMAEMMTKIIIIQDVSNRERPTRPKPKVKSGSPRGG